MFLNQKRQEEIQLKNLEEKAYGSRDKAGSDDLYNFDLQPLIEEFSFEDLVHLKFEKTYGYDDMLSYGYNNQYPAKNRAVTEYGAFLVITDKQYILGFNSDKGCGSHHCSFARCMADLLGGKKINTYEDAKYYKELCEKKFITARITYQKTSSIYGSSNFTGRILFNFGYAPITEGKLRSFEKFVEDHGNELNYISRTYGFQIEYLVDYYTEKNCDLSKVLRFAKYHMDPEAMSISSEDEIIIGVPTEHQKTLIKK